MNQNKVSYVCCHGCLALRPRGRKGVKGVKGDHFRPAFSGRRGVEDEAGRGVHLPSSSVGNPSTLQSTSHRHSISLDRARSVSTPPCPRPRQQPGPSRVGGLGQMLHFPGTSKPHLSPQPLLGIAMQAATDGAGHRLPSVVSRQLRYAHGHVWCTQGPRWPQPSREGSAALAGPQRNRERKAASIP